MKSKYGYWKVKKEINDTEVLCQCDCKRKTQKVILKKDLKEGRTLGCGHQALRNANSIDRKGLRYGSLMVVEATDGVSNPNRLAWLCECDCGNMLVVQPNNLTSGNTKSCGCSRVYNHDITGQKFGLLTVLGVAPKPETTTVDRVSYWYCQCECGNQTVVRRNSLTTGNSKSCGSCLRESFGERQINEILKKANCNYIREYTPDNFILATGGRPRFDFAIFDNQDNLIRLIEFDGEQHFINRDHFGRKNAYEITKQRDEEKNKWAETNKIPLRRIPYTLENQISYELIFNDEVLTVQVSAKESYEARCREHHIVEESSNERRQDETS